MCASGRTLTGEEPVGPNAFRDKVYAFTASKMAPSTSFDDMFDAYSTAMAHRRSEHGCGNRSLQQMVASGQSCGKWKARIFLATSMSLSLTVAGRR